jgi:hypothetical protein
MLLVDAASGVVDPKKRSPPAVWNAKHGYAPEDRTPAKLFDLAADPGQRRNLAAERPETVSELRNLLRQTREAARSAPLPESSSEQ